jgi:hypothetical protein
VRTVHVSEGDRVAGGAVLVSWTSERRAFTEAGDFLAKAEPCCSPTKLGTT